MCAVFHTLVSFLSLQLESVAAITCGICLFNATTGNAPSPLTLTADSQLLQAARLLDSIQAAAEQAAAAMEHHNSPQQQRQPNAAPALAAAAAAYLGTSQNVSQPDSNGSSSSGARVQLGAVLYCCQAMLALRGLAADLSAGIACCRQLQDELLLLLAQVGSVNMRLGQTHHVYPASGWPPRKQRHSCCTS